MYANNLVDEHDMLHPPLTNAIKDSAPKKTPHSIFEGGRISEFSLGACALRE